MTKDLEPNSTNEGFAIDLAVFVRESVDQIYIVNALSGRFVYANQRAREATGYTIEELCEMTPLDLQAGIDFETLMQRVGPLQRGETEFVSFDAVYHTKDGTDLPVEHSVQYLASHQPPVYLVHARPLESALSEREPVKEPHLYRRLVEEADEGIWVIDDEQRTTYANGAIADMLGYTREEMLGKLVFDFMDDEGKAIATRNFERRRQGVHEQLEFKYLRKDGSEIWTIIAVRPLFDTQGTYTGAYAIVTDITERKLRERALLQSLHVTSPDDLIAPSALPVLGGGPGLPSAAVLRADRLGRRFGVLADPQRLRLIELLSPGQELSVGAICAALGMSQPNVSKHLKVLYEAGLLSRRSEGTRAFYAMADPTAAILCRVVCQWLGNQAQAEYEALAG